MDGSLPAVPALLRPRDGAVKTAVPAFTWYAATGAKFYIFEYRPEESIDDEGWVSSAALTTLSYQPLEMTGDVYEWRVRALDKAGNVSLPSLTRTITLDLP